MAGDAHGGTHARPASNQCSHAQPSPSRTHARPPALSQARSRVNHPDYTSPLDQITVVGDFMSDLGYICKQWQHQKKS